MNPATPQPVIEFRNVCKSFGEKNILNGLNLKVMPGEVLCVIGGSGTGKSVTLKLLLNLLPIDSGEIYFKGQLISEMDEDEINVIRRDIGMVFQGSALFDSLNVFENVAYPLRDLKALSEEEIERRALEKLSLVGLADAAQQSVADLSGGMKKRVGLARAIATDPQVILYDEPTAGLDPFNVNRIDDLITQINRDTGATSIVVTHHMESVYRIAHRVAFLWDKKIYFYGTLNEFKNTSDQHVQNFICGRAG